MATYVFSDVHGHRAALERALDRVSPSEDDRFFCLGDMIDRGPDPVGVLRVVRGLPNVTVLMGNHEDLMIDCVNNPGDGLAAMNWGLNGGAMTSAGLSEIEDDEASELLGWVAGLPRWSSARVAGRLFLFVHAGVRLGHVTPEAWGDAAVETFFSSQDPEDLTWIREDFWGAAEERTGPGRWWWPVTPLPPTSSAWPTRWTARPWGQTGSPGWCAWARTAGTWTAPPLRARAWGRCSSSGSKTRRSSTSRSWRASSRRGLRAPGSRHPDRAGTPLGPHVPQWSGRNRR